LVCDSFDDLAQLLSTFPSRLKKVFEEGGARIREHSGTHFESMVEARIVADLVQATDCARLWILCAVNDPGDSSIDERTGTHRAGLQGDIQGAVIDPPVPGCGRGLAQSHNFGVPGWIPAMFAGIETDPNDGIVSHD